ncbi:hypothetical protein VTO42DRAFT_1006 [Malbranchea cinnamomea]
MPRKRKQSSSNDTPSAKRSRPQPASDDEVPSTSNVAPPQPPIDPIFGQKHAFPGLDDLTDEGALPYGPPGDGLEYLRMVRKVADNFNCTLSRFPGSAVCAALA